MKKIGERIYDTVKIILILLIFLLFLWDVGVGLLILLPQYQPILVEGKSMSPLLNPRDFVVIKTKFSPKELQPGTIIAYSTDEGEYIIHRLLLIDNGNFITRGDNNFHTDQEIFGYKTRLENVIGIYLFKIPNPFKYLIINKK